MVQVQLAAVQRAIAEDAGTEAVAIEVAARVEACATAHGTVEEALVASGARDMDVASLTEADARLVEEAVRCLDEELAEEPALQPLVEVGVHEQSGGMQPFDTL